MNKIRKVVLLAALFLMVSNSSVFADEAVNDAAVKRLQGKSRIETSIEVSKEAFVSSKTAILVGYNGEVDALTGTILAEDKKAPILMTYKNKLDHSLLAELNRLEVEELIIVGGSSVVEESVERELRNLGFKVRRIKGSSREETAINVSKEVIAEDSEEAFLTLGYGVYADALAIGPIAANKGLPLLLSQGKKIGQENLDFLEEAGIKKLTIIGGKNAIDPGVEEDLRKKGFRVNRIDGSSREETAIKIAREYIKNPKKIMLANGYVYADAVVGGYLAARENAPILLSNNKQLKDINKEYIGKKKLDTIILGGRSSIDDSIYRDIKEELGILDEISSEFELPEDRIEPSLPISPSIEINPPSSNVISNFKDLKSSMKEELEAFKSDISIQYSGDIEVEDVRAIIRDIYSDGSYIGGAIKTITPRIRKNEDFIEVNLSAGYYNTIAEEEFMDREVSKILKAIIRPEMSDFEKVRAVHDYIVNNTSYSSETKKTAHSAYAVFTESKAVCQGYALATYRLLDALGIENYYIIGDSLNGSNWNLHAWNLVKIDGDYYNLDTTKNDPLVKDGNHILSYRYFLVSDESFSKTHRPNRDIFPKARSKKYEVLNKAYNPSEYKGNLYFGNSKDGDKLYSISLKNLELKKLADIRSPYLVVDKDKIYISNYSNRGYIFSMDMNGKNLKQLNKVHSKHLKLKDSSIEFFNEDSKKWDKIDI